MNARTLRDTIIEGDCVGGTEEVEQMGAMYFREICGMVNNGLSMRVAQEEALLRIQDWFFSENHHRSASLKIELEQAGRRPA